MNNKILILGSTGTVGQHLIDALLAKGEQVKAAARHPEKRTPRAGLEAVLFDFNDPSTFDTALEGVDRLFAVAPTGVLNPLPLLTPVLQAAQQRGIKIVFQSAIGVDADDHIPLRQVELLIEGAGLPYVVLRPNWFMDNFHTYWYPMVQKGTLALPAGDAATSLIDARDIALSAAGALTNSAHDGKAFVLTGGEALSYQQATAVLSAALGRTIEYTPSDPESFVQTLVGQNFPEDYARMLTVLFSVVQQGWTAFVTSDVQTLAGKTPYTLQEYVQHHRARWEAANLIGQA